MCCDRNPDGSIRPSTLCLALHYYVGTPLLCCQLEPLDCVSRLSVPGTLINHYKTYNRSRKSDAGRTLGRWDAALYYYVGTPLLCCQLEPLDCVSRGIAIPTVSPLRSHLSVLYYRLTLFTADDYNSKVLSERGGAGQRVGYNKNRPAGFTQQNHPESHRHIDRDERERLTRQSAC